MVSRTLALLALTLALAGGARALAGDASRKPLVILSYYDGEAFDRLVNEVKVSHLDERATVIFGNYGVSATQSQRVHEIPGARYAPIFSLVRGGGGMWNARPTTGPARHEPMAAAPAPAPVTHARGLAQALESPAEEALESPAEESFEVGFEVAASPDAGALTSSSHGLPPFGGDAPANAPAPADFNGAVPLPGELHALHATDRATWLAWGREIGRRFRDEIRAARNQGVLVDSWQFDEISASAGDPEKGPGIRAFAAAALEGVFRGRVELQDEPLRGLAYIANSAFKVADLPRTPELGAFWSAIDRTCFAFVGEEYPTFTETPASQVLREGRLQRALEKQGGAMARVAAKYVAGCSPGYRITRDGAGNVDAHDLGGNIHGWEPRQVNPWRTAYLETRLREGAIGLGEFAFVHGNADAVIVHYTIDSLASACAR